MLIRYQAGSLASTGVAYRTFAPYCPGRLSVRQLLLALNRLEELSTVTDQPGGGVVRVGFGSGFGGFGVSDVGGGEDGAGAGGATGAGGAGAGAAGAVDRSGSSDGTVVGPVPPRRGPSAGRRATSPASIGPAPAPQPTMSA